LTLQFRSRKFGRTRRESVLAAVSFRLDSAAPPKGHTQKLSGKRTGRVEVHSSSE
jgi:hypothetical protein